MTTWEYGMFSLLETKKPVRYVEELTDQMECLASEICQAVRGGGLNEAEVQSFLLQVHSLHEFALKFKITQNSGETAGHIFACMEGIESLSADCKFRLTNG